MSSAAAAALVAKAGASTAAGGIARRARVQSLDGLTRGALRVVSPSGAAGSSIGSNPTTRGRSRSLTSDAMGAGYTSAMAGSVTSRREAFGGGRGGGAGSAGAGMGEGGQFLAGGSAALALAALTATSDEGEDDWARDKTGGGGAVGSGGLMGGRSSGTAWCHAQQPAPPTTPQQQHQQQQQQLPPLSHEHRSLRAAAAGGGALGAAEHSSMTSSSGNRCRTSEVDDFRAQKDLESIRAVKLDGGSTSVAAAAAAASTASVGVAGSQQQQLEAPKRITDVYHFDNNGQPVGRGNRSTVSTATHRLTGQPVAVKRMLRSETSRSQVMEEVNMLKVAGAHPNVVTMQAFFEDQDAFYIVMEMCQGGELYHRLADKGRYSEGQAARIMAEVAEAVGFLHRQGIVHFDLKPENIMLAVGDDCVPEVRLADFGSAFMQHRQICTARDYTVAYSAPEVLTRQAVDEKVDMWALGVVMWVVLTGRHPFDASVNLSEEEVARRVAEQEPDLRSPGIRHVSPEGKDLVRRLLARDPEDRPSAHQMLSHPWLKAVMTRAKATSRSSKQQLQQRRRERVTEAVCVGSPGAVVAAAPLAPLTPSALRGAAAGEGGGVKPKVSPPRRRRAAAGTGQLEEGGVGASVAAATVAAVASVTGGEHLSA